MSATPFKAEESGLLVVFMRPGAHVTLEEFHEWYDQEHVPLRIHRFDTFRSAVRYQVTSSSRHSADASSQVDSMEGTEWGAFYTISSNAVFSDPSYTSLRSQRSEREAELFTRLGLVDRRIYRLEYDSDLDPSLASFRAKTFGLTPQPSPDAPIYTVTNSVTMTNTTTQTEYNQWFQTEHIPLLAKAKGWRRSRRFVLIDNGVTGKDAKEGDAEKVPKVLGLHEWDVENPEQTDEFKAACTTEWRQRVLGEGAANLVTRERKTCRLYRGWDCVAAIQAQQAGKKSD